MAVHAPLDVVGCVGALEAVEAMHASLDVEEVPVVHLPHIGFRA